MYKLFLDDLRSPPSDDYVVCRSSEEAIKYIINNGWPLMMSLDHDLGESDTAMVFLKSLYKIWNGEKIPIWQIHSQNPIGKANIASFLTSWQNTVG